MTVNPVQLFPASNNQIQLWFAHQADPSNPEYNTFLSFEVTGTIDRQALEAAIDDLITRHEPLRTTFEMVEGELHQVVGPPIQVPVQRKVVPRHEVDEVLYAAVSTPFDLERGPLVRVHVFDVEEHHGSDGHTILLLEFHHIVIDGWSAGILMDDLGDAYRARRHGRAPTWSPCDFQLADYIDRQAESANTPFRTSERAWWAHYLDQPPPPVSPPLDRPRTIPATPEAGRVTIALPEELDRRLQDLARQVRCSPPTLVVTAFAALLASRSGAPELTVGVPLAGRVHPETERLVGFLVTTVPVRLAFDPASTFAEASTETRNRMADVSSHQELSLDEIITASRPPQIDGHTALFDVLVVTQNTGDLGLDLDGARCRLVDTPASWTRFDLELNVWDDRPLSVMLTHRQSIIDEASAEAMTEQLVALLDAAAQSPETSVADLLATLDVLAVCPGGTDTESANVADHIRSLPGMNDAIAVRARTGDGERLIVYAAPEAEGLTEERLLEAGRTVAPDLAGVAMVRRIQRDRYGGVDFTALEGTVVVDDGLTRRWHDCLRSRGFTPSEITVEWATDQLSTRPVPPPRDRLLPVSSGSTPTQVDEPATASAPIGTPSDAEIVLAISDGGPASPLRFNDLGDALEAAAATDRSVTFVDDHGRSEVVAYADLLKEAKSLAAGFEDVGLITDAVVPVIYAIDRSVVPVLWAGLLAGIGIAPIRHRPGTPNLRSRVAQIRSRLGETMIVADDLDDELTAAGHDRAHQIPVARLRSDVAAGRGTFERPSPDLDRTAIVVLTSGSTKAPKAVPITHRMILTRSDGAAAACGLGSSDISLNWMPLEHVGGIVMFHLRDIVLGCNQILASTNWILADPIRWMELADAYRVTTSWAPNFAFGLVADEAERLAERPLDLSNLVHVLNGGEAVRADTVARFLDALVPHGLPADAVRPAWGMSETCSGETDANGFDPRDTDHSPEAADRPVSVGAPYPGFAMRIVDGAGAIVTEGTVGYLQVRGDGVFGGYLNDTEGRNQSAFVDGWFHTGDIALLANGELVVTGRDKGDVLVNGVNVASEVIEDLVEATGLVEPSFTVAIGVDDPATGTENVTVFAAPRRGQSHDDAAHVIQRTVAEHYGLSPVVVFVDRSAIPKTNIGKRQRQLLRQRHDSGELEPLLTRARPADRGQVVPDVVRAVEWCREARIHPPARPERMVLIGSATERNRAVVASVADRGIAVELLAADDAPSTAAAMTSALALGADRIALVAARTAWSTPFDAAQKAVATQTHYRRLLAQVVGDESPGIGRGERQLVVVADDIAPTPGATGLYLPGGVLRGLIESANQESDQVVCRLLATTADTAATDIADELLARESGATVALTSQGRFVPRLARRSGSPNPEAPPWLRPGAPILVTGGLGPVGKLLVDHLRRRHEARLLIVGRRPLAEVHGDLGGLGITPEDPSTQYVGLDVTSMADLAEAISKAEAAWHAPIAGAFHLANRRISDQIARTGDLGADLEDMVEHNLAAKVEGAGALATVIADRPDVHLVWFSSIVGWVGHAMNSDYAAANSFLDLLAHAEGGPTSQSLAWGSWAESMSDADRLRASLAVERGVRSLSTAEAVGSLDSALTLNDRHLLLGVDDTRAWMAARSTRPGTGSRTVSAWTRGPLAGRRTDSADSLVVPDVLGFPSPFTLVSVHGSEDDEVRGAAALDPPAGAGDHGSVERIVEQIWCQLLRLETVDRHASFFDLGGTSVLLSRMQGRLQHEGFEISLVDLLAHRSIASLARALDQQSVSDLEPEPSAHRLLGTDQNPSDTSNVRDQSRGRRRATARRQRRRR